MNAGGPTAFDPYYMWLGIPPNEQPPNHYRLLGLRNFEANVRAIENAADRLMLQVRSFQAGPNGVVAQRLLNEISTARIVLCDDAKKAAYDRQLHSQAQPQQMPQPAASQYAMQQPLSVAASLPQPVYPQYQHGPPPHNTPPHVTPTYGVAAPLPLRPTATHAVATSAAPVMVINTHDLSSGTSAVRSSVRRRPAQGGNLVMTLVKAAIGGAGGISLGVVIVWIGWRADPFGLFSEKPKQTATVTKPAVNSANQQPTKTIPPAQSNIIADGGNKASATTAASSVRPTGQQTPPTQNATESPAEEEPTKTASNPTRVPASSNGSASTSLPTTIGSSQTSPRPLPGTSDPPPLNNPAPFGSTEPASPPPPMDRATPPSPETQKTKLAELKEIYKSEFDSSTKPANREPFIEFLTTTAGKVKSDPDAQFVLYREAYDRAVALKDFSLAAKVIDSIEETFEVDPFRLRTHLLTQASPAAKQAPDRLIVARCALELADAAVRQKRVADAKKLSTIAEVHVKLSQDPQFRSQSLAELVEIDKLAAQAAPVERAQKTLEENPDSPEANLILGKYRCFSEGAWQDGLPMLARSADEKLSAAARSDLEATSQDAEPLEMGDAWFDVAKSNDDLKPCYARAQHWYQQALETSDGLERIKLEQRLEQIAAMDLPRPQGPVASTSPLRKFSQMFGSSESFDPVNVFTHLNPAVLRGNAPWSGSGDSLFSNSRTARAWLQSTYAPPREYQVTMKVRRSDTPSPGDPGFIIGLSTPKQQFIVAIDAVVAGGYATVISMPGLKVNKPNPTLVTYTDRKLGDTYRFDPVTRSYSYGSTIVCEVSPKKVRVLVDGQEITTFDGEFNQLGVPREWAVPDPRALFIGSHMARFEVSRWSVEPIDDNR